MQKVNNVSVLEEEKSFRRKKVLEEEEKVLEDPQPVIDERPKSSIKKRKRN